MTVRIRHSLLRLAGQVDWPFAAGFTAAAALSWARGHLLRTIIGIAVLANGGPQWVGRRIETAVILDRARRAEERQDRAAREAGLR